MRHLLLALMIALLPIRGWMGDAMALAMLAAPSHGMAAASSPAAAPCPDHAMAADTTAMADSGHSADSTHVHKSCDVCNGPAMALALPDVPAVAPQHSLLTPPAARFASFEPQQANKPPIS